MVPPSSYTTPGSDSGFHRSERGELIGVLVAVGEPSEQPVGLSALEPGQVEIAAALLQLRQKLGSEILVVLPETAIVKEGPERLLDLVKLDEHRRDRLPAQLDRGQQTAGSPRSPPCPNAARSAAAPPAAHCCSAIARRNGRFRSGRIRLGFRGFTRSSDTRALTTSNITHLPSANLSIINTSAPVLIRTVAEMITAEPSTHAS